MKYTSKIYKIIILKQFLLMTKVLDSLSILKSIKKIILDIVNEKNLGQSQSIYNGIKIAKYDTIVTLDGDGQNDPKDILIFKYFLNQMS